MGFENAVEIVLKHEGGYVAHPKDPGGETKFGISKRSYPHIDIKNLTKEKAIAIYRQDFWEKVGIEALPEALQLMVFDTAVNIGPQRAVGFLQAVVGAKVDGDLGPKTIARVGEFDPVEVLRKFTLRRLDFYLGLNTFPVFGRGWMKRLLDVFMRSTPMVGVFHG